MAQRHSEKHKERMAAKAARRTSDYERLSDPKRVETLLTYGLRPRYDSRGLTVEQRWLPHQGEREIARRQARV